MPRVRPRLVGGQSKLGGRLMCRSYSGDPSSAAYACDCHLNEDDEPHRADEPKCIHGRPVRLYCHICRVAMDKGIPLSELRQC